MEEQINYDNHPDESKTRTHRHNKVPDDGDPWAPINLLKYEAKDKHQLNCGGASNRQEAPAATNKREYLSLTPDRPPMSNLSRQHSYQT